MLYAAISFCIFHAVYSVVFWRADRKGMVALQLVLFVLWANLVRRELGI